MKRTARHWYHCTERCHGQTWTARRVCTGGMGDREPRTPRLCVASTIAGCIAARYFTRDVYVYRTARPRRAVRPVGVWDAQITGERWLIPPVEMVLECVIPSLVICTAQADIHVEVAMRRCTTPKVRLRALSRTIEVLADAGIETDESLVRAVRRAMREVYPHLEEEAAA